jgi:hypothetical protein
MPRALPCTLLLTLGLLAPASLPAADAPDDALRRLTGRLGTDAASIRSVLGDYNQIEAAKRHDVFGRQQIHEGLLKALKDIKDPALKEVADSFLKNASKTAFPAQVLLLKTAIGDAFPAPREQRLEMLAAAAGHKDRRLSTWGIRLLGDSRWPEAVDRMIALLRDEESKNPNSLLASMLSLELYRVLGSAGRGTAGEVQKRWEDGGKKIPASPDYGSGGAGEVTVVFFGDRVSPAAVLAIDTSSSMLQLATLRDSVARGSTSVKGQGKAGPKIPKVDIVKKELAQAVSGLQSHCRFNILAYNATFVPWKAAGRSGLSLHTAGKEAVRSATEFARNLPVAQGTNIHDTLAAALAIEEVETVYLLSDGVPTRGGGPAEVEKRAAAMNYLSGVRIVTYGFTAEESGSFDEEFMKRLARNNWGWYRRLN